MEASKMANAISMESLSSVGGESLANGTSNTVRTLFVSGLPMDAKPRELYLLFRAYRGYESSLLRMTAKNGKPTSPVGFVTFQTRQDADEARKHLQGVRFDPECAQVLRLELAKSNTKVSRPKQSPPPHHGLSLGSAAAAPMSAASAIPQFLAPLQPDMSSFLADPHSQQLLLEHQHLMALTQQAATQAYAAQALQAAYLPTAASVQIPAHFYAAAAAANAAAMQAAPAISSGRKTACSTLFVANLSTTVNEDDLRSVFMKYPGFTRLRMHNKNGSCCAFVEYTDLRHASQAMLGLQGCQIPGATDRNGLRIEYAKNKMADVNG